MEALLRKIGFEEKEAKVYLTLLRIGQAPASRVAKETGYERTSTYYLLLRMLEKGYVGEYIKGDVKTFKATTPKTLKENIREQQMLLEEIMPQLEKLSEHVQEETIVEVRIGKEGFKHLYRDAIANSKEVLGLGIDDSQYMDFDKWSLQQYYRDAEKTGLKERFITYPDAFIYGSKISTYKTIPKTYFQPTPTFIYGDRVVIITWHPTPTLIFIQSKELANAYKKHFELLWKSANPKKK